jgi:hypothetical protein
MLDQFPETCLAMFDDGLEGVASLPRNPVKTYRDPVFIQQLIENGCNIQADLGLSLYCWSRTSHAASYTSCEPFSFIGPASGGFIVRGRKFRFDEKLLTNEDVDFSLQALMTDRIVLQDTRSCFLFENTTTRQAGGIDDLVANAERGYLESKWGGSITFGDSTIGKPAPCRITVRRQDAALVDL